MGSVRQHLRWWLVSMLVVLLVGVVFAPAAEASGSGYWYTVQPGDSWSSISAATGVPVGTLQAWNPGAVRPPHYWLMVGEWLWIPTVTPPPPPCDYWYTVRSGDSWAKISRWSGVSVAALQAANPGLVRPPRHWLYVGDRMWIPCGGGGWHPGGYWYTVVRGDSWHAISRRTGVSVAALQAANPGKVRPPKYWLYVGDRLWIPDP